MTCYFDASALAKLLIHEAGAEAVDESWAAADDRYASLVGYAELRGSIGRAVRSRRMIAGDAQLARVDLELLWGRLTTVNVDHGLVRAAGELADRHALGALDAVHLASALAIAMDGETPAFVCFDVRLRGAAAQEGLRVLPEVA